MASGSQNMTTYKAKQLVNTYGSTTEPIYINAGVPTILGTIGGTTKPVWINNGVVTEMTAGTTAQFYRGDKTWSNSLLGDISIGTRGTTSGPSSITYSNRITIVPYFHTGGPWYIKSGDDASNAYLALYYNTTQLMRIKHDGTQMVDWKGNANTASKWASARTLTIGATGKSVDGSGNISWSMNEIMGSSDSTKFYRGDKAWSNALTGGLELGGNLSFTNSGTAFRGINYGTMGDNDQWRIGGAATAANSGYMELATADDATEPIYVRQYSGVFSTLKRTLTLLDGSGHTTIPGRLYIDQPSTARTNGIIGSYDSNRAAAIWAMGNSYQIATDGSGLGTLYGAAYAYTGRNYIGSQALAGGHMFVWAQNGTPYVALGDHVWSKTTASSWLDGQRYNRAAYNVDDMTDTGSYWPWMRGTNTGSKKWFSLGVLNNSFYIMGSTTSRTANSYDYCWRFDVSNGYLYGNFSGSLSGNASSATKLETARNINGTSFNGTAAITTANWGTARTLTIGGTGKSVNGSGNVSWSKAEILGSSDATKFYRGDQSWSNTLTGTLILSSTTPIQFNGFGTGTYTCSVFYCDSNGITLETPRASNSTSGAIKPFLVKTRGGNWGTIKCLEIYNGNGAAVRLPRMTWGTVHWANRVKYTFAGTQKAGYIDISFGYTYDNPPAVFVTDYNSVPSGYGFVAYCQIQSVSRTGCRIVSSLDDAQNALSGFYTYWVAIGI